MQVVLLKYFLILIFSCNCIGQRVNLGYAGIVASGLAILASFGLCSLIGVSFVSIVGVVPFLVIGMYNINKILPTLQIIFSLVNSTQKNAFYLLFCHFHFLKG